MIPISRTSECAIRALTYLAQQPDDGFVLARTMADELDVPGPYLAKILQTLVSRGLLHSQRGRHGGFSLAKSPSDVTLYEVVDVLENVRGPNTCFLGQAECSDERACPMHRFWSRATMAFRAQLTGTSLADVVRFCKRNPGSGYPLPGRG